MISLLCVVLMAGLGTLLMHRMVPEGGRTMWMVKCLLGAGAGFGIGSCTLFLTGLVFDGLSSAALITEFIVLFLVLGVVWRRVDSRPSRLMEPTAAAVPGRLVPALTLLCLIVAAIDGWRFIELSAAIPHGSWDAWAIWNVHARFLSRAHHDWTGIFEMARGHPDYPLLLPLTTARFWLYLQSETTIVPRVVSFAYLFGTVAALVGLLALLKGWAQALLAGLVILSTHAMIDQATWQNADVALAFYFLSTLGLLCLHDRLRDDATGLRSGALVAAGAMAALSAWTKNEGLLFVLLVFLVHAARCVRDGGWRRARREILDLGFGALPVLLVVALARFGYGPGNDLIAGQDPGRSVERLMDVNRYVLVARAAGTHMRQLSGSWLWLLPVYALLTGTRVRENFGSGARVALGVLVLMHAGYFVVYVLTPKALAWHLETSALRLAIQLWPSTVLLFFLATASPDEAYERQGGPMRALAQYARRSGS